MSNYIADKERAYQNRILKIFREELRYTYLGNFQYAKGKNVRVDGKTNAPVLEERLFTNLRERPDDKGQAAYSPSQCSEVCEKLRRELSAVNGNLNNLIEVNSRIYDLMVDGIKARPFPDENDEDVMLFDFKNVENNDFAIAEEVSFIDPLTGKHSRPDFVVYVNGIAVAVIELKRSLVSLDEGIKQNLSNERDLIPSFFPTTQFTVAASDGNGFKYATIGTPRDFWCYYKDDSHRTGAPLSDVECFRQFFNKENLMLLLRYGVITDCGIKKVMRPHQFHALRAAIPRLKAKESGVIWHSQGSGKSLTMIWLAAYIKSNFSNPRVVVITDRTEFDNQIKLNFDNSKHPTYQAKSQQDFLDVLNKGEEWLICSLINKFGNTSSDPDAPTYHDGVSIRLDKYLEKLHERIERDYPNFKAKGDNIFVFVDECHRTQGGKLHEAMRSVMGENVMLIGFTGTPLLKKDKKNDFASIQNTSQYKFGPFIHKYLHKEAVDDKVILDLTYEYRDVAKDITDSEKLQEKFNTITQGLTDERKKIIETRWARLENVWSSSDPIKKIGYSILDDLETYPLKEPWCNAMLVAGNIMSAFRYYEFFQTTPLKGHCAVVTSYEPSDNDLRKDSSDPDETTEQKYKYGMAKLLLADAGQPSMQNYEKWAKYQFVHHPGTMKLMIVVDKLLTGFDAPNATILYIDKEMKDHTLFQAICRVNRLGRDVRDKDKKVIAVHHKEWGKIVDFKGLFQQITDAVVNFNDERGGFGGFDKEDVAGLLADHVNKCKVRLELAKESYDALRATWQDKSRDEVIESYLTDSVVGNETIPAATKRKALYSITSQFVTAYENLADHISEAGYSKSEAEAIETLVREASSVHRHVKQRSGDEFDPCQKDPQMRALLDRFIKAEEAKTLIKDVDDFSFLDLIDLNAAPEEAARKTGSARGAAEVIEGKTRSVINSYREKNPEIYKQFSEKLQELLETLKNESADYQKRMVKLLELLKALKNGGDGCPPAIDTKFGKALYQNRGDWMPDTPTEDSAVDQVKTVARIVDEDAPDGFATDPVKGEILRAELAAELNLNEEQLYNLFNLIVRNFEEK